MLKLMVIDDQAVDRKSVEKIARPLSYVEWIGGFKSPQDALIEAIIDIPDVVIASVEIAEMNGLSFTTVLQEILPSASVIVSARNGDYARLAFEAGARGYLIKPIKKENLMKVLNHVKQIRDLEVGKNV